MKIQIKKYTGEGELYPRWYLPVYREYEKYWTVCYPFFIAPFVLIWKLLEHAFYSIWHDLMGLLKDYQQREYIRFKK